MGFRRFRRPRPEIPAFRYSTQLPHASGKVVIFVVQLLLLLLVILFLLLASFVAVGYRVACIASADLFHSQAAPLCPLLAVVFACVCLLLLAVAC